MKLILCMSCILVIGACTTSGQKQVDNTWDLKGPQPLPGKCSVVASVSPYDREKYNDPNNPVDVTFCTNLVLDVYDISGNWTVGNASGGRRMYSNQCVNIEDAAQFGVRVRSPIANPLRWFYCLDLNQFELNNYDQWRVDKQLIK